MKPHIITLTGSLGSGKSSTANGVAKILGYQRFSAGDFQRAAAASMGITYEEYQKVAEKDPSCDRRADDALVDAGTKGDSVIDARLGYHFIPSSYKVMLRLDPSIAAARILKDAESNPNRHNEMAGGAHDVETIVTSIEKRRENDKQRYKQFYNIENPFDANNFDLVVDTSARPLEEVIQIVINGYQKWLES